MAGKAGAAGLALCALIDPDVLQAVLVGKGQGRGAGKGLCGGAMGHPAFDIAKRGGGAVAQAAQWQGIAALQWAGMGGDGGGDLAPAEPVLRDILIVDDDVIKKAVGRGQGGDDPGGEAVGVDCDAQGGGASVGAGEFGRKGLFQEHHLIMMPDQAQAGGGGRAGGAAPDEEGADTFLQRLEPLGDGGWGDVQFGGGKVKGAAPVNGGEGGELGGIKH